MSEYMRAIYIVKDFRSGARLGDEPAPFVRRRLIEATLTIEQLRAQDRDVIDGFFASVVDAREARLAILVEKHGRHAAAEIAAQLAEEEDS